MKITKSIGRLLLSFILLITMLPVSSMRVYADDNIADVTITLQPGDGSGSPVVIHSRDNGSYYGESTNGAGVGNGQFYMYNSQLWFRFPDCPGTFSAPGDGQIFVGWKIAGKGVNLIAGNQYQISSDLSLTAQWAQAGNTKLLSLTPSSGTLDQEFDPDCPTYLVSVFYTGSPVSVTIQGIPQDPDATVSYRLSTTSNYNDTCPPMTDGSELLNIRVTNGAKEEIYNVRISIYYTLTLTTDGEGTVKTTDNLYSGPQNSRMDLSPTPADGWKFKEWQIVSGGGRLDYPSYSNCSYFFGSDNAVVKAVFEKIPTYEVTVNNGTGGGNYVAGASVTITADTPQSGKQFKEWTGTNGLTFTNGSATSASATFTMPANAVTLTATYKDLDEASITATDKNYTFVPGATYDVSQMFSFGSGTGTPTYSIVTGESAGTGAGTLSGAQLTITKAGTIKIKVNTAATANVAAGEATAVLTVAKADAVITIADDKNSYAKKYGDNAFVLGGITTNVGNAQLAYTVTAGSDVVRVSDSGVVTLLKPGTAAVTVSLPGTDNYNAGSSQPITITVAKGDAPKTKPSSTMTVAYSVDKVDSVSLPAGWTWVTSDKDKTLTAGSSITVTAEYTASDRDYYNGDLTAAVTITRQSKPSGGDSNNNSNAQSASVIPTVPVIPVIPINNDPEPVPQIPINTVPSRIIPDPGKPFIEENPERSGWDAIKEDIQAVITNKVADSSAENTVMIDMDGSKKVPGDIISEIKGQDVTAVFDLGDGIKWSINGMDITGSDIKDIDLAVALDTNSIPGEVVTPLVGERYSRQISLAYEGDFGLTATLSVDMDAKNAGLFANLFYFNETKDELEFICANQIANDGTAELAFTHASDYVIVVDKEPMDGSFTEPEAHSENTVTGLGTQERTVESTLEETVSQSDARSPWRVIAICGAAIAIGLSAFYVIMKRKQ